MLTIHLEHQMEQVWLGENPAPATFSDGYKPLYHQWLTYNAAEPIIVNTFNTGTGKTKAALLRLLKRAKDIGFSNLSMANHNVLLIAPTNELLAQHVRDARNFCTENELPYRVVAISRADLDQYQQIPGFSESDLRRGAALHSIIQDNRKVKAVTGGGNKQTPAIFVVNPDIFYYAFYFCYSKNDRLPLFSDFMSQFNYIIIDELHYYNPKQFANFLFFMQLSKFYGCFNPQTQRQFCLLTATPNPNVRQYLENLHVLINWITPERSKPDEKSLTKDARALAPVELKIFSLDEQDLVNLAGQQGQNLATWLAEDPETGGAIISGALWRINQIYQKLRPVLNGTLMGRLTGAENTEGRTIAKGRRLILATPTVDIGYNFDREAKARQNIDFLLLDARTSDEFIQRLGRAGRVLGKPVQDVASQVLAVVSPEFYAVLKPYDGQSLGRAELRQLAEANLPPRQALYTYIQSGAIAEAFLPIYRLEAITATDKKPDLEDLFNQVHSLFAAKASFTYKSLRGSLVKFTQRDGFYAGLENLSKAERRKKYVARLQDQHKLHKDWGDNPISSWAAKEWLEKDLCGYYVEKARYSFREYFQAPAALVSDTKNLLSSADVSIYDALHVATNYKAKYFQSVAEWQQVLHLEVPPEGKDALVFCDLYEMRRPEERLKLKLTLDEGEKSKVDWEQQFTRWPTALYGLELAAIDNSRGVGSLEIQNMFKERYIPALVVAKDSRADIALRMISKQAQFIIYPLEVTFSNGKRHNYNVVLGTMALQVYADIPPAYLALDKRDSERADDSCLIF